MRPEVRDRLVLPVMIPLGALAFILLATVGFGWLLLSMPAEVATAVAIMAAVSVLSVFSVLARRSRLSSGAFTLMIGVAAVPFVLGGAVGAGFIDIAEEEEHHEPVTFEVEIAAEDIAFDRTEIEVPAGTEIDIIFDNRDEPPNDHNIHLFDGPDRESPSYFSEPPFGGPRTVTYEIGKLDPGSYFFVCDVHPNMTGTITAVEADAPPSEEEEETEPPTQAEKESVEVSADALAFDTQRLVFPAGIPVEIIFENRETESHNIEIFEGSEASGSPVFRGDIFAGPETRTYQVPTLEAGSYYFQCQVHPFMNGTLEVS